MDPFPEIPPYSSCGLLVGILILTVGNVCVLFLICV